ncbi:MAG: tetratricopeptide repeat protein [Deltaproteobacteria bacterium]|nr:MAG: tetratricopeptide repeat protein [Deltaproteobacteria bacterium]
MKREALSTNVARKGTAYQVRTEDLAPQEGVIQTLVFREGNLLSVEKSRYEGVFDPSDEVIIRKCMSDQHAKVLERLYRGDFDRIAAFLEIALQAYRKGDDELALESFQNVFDLDPEQPTAQHHMELIRESLKQHPSRRVALIERVSREATKRFQEGRLTEAKRKLEILRLIEAEQTATHLLRRNTGAPSELHRDTLKTILNIGLISFIFFGGVTLSVILGYAAFERKLHTTVIEGNEAVEAGQLEQAINAYTTGLMMKPSRELRITLLYNRGEAYRKLGLMQRAVQDWEAALALAPEDPQLLEKIARFSFGRKDYAKAISLLERLRNVQPLPSELIVQLATAYLRSGQPFESIKLLESAHLSTYEGALALAEACNLLGRDAEAEANYRKALEIRPNDEKALMALGNFYFSTGELRKALDCWEKVLAMRQDGDEDLFLRMGRAHLYQGEPIEALHLLEKAREKNPMSAVVHSYLGITYHQLGHRDLARKMWEEALLLDPSEPVANEQLRNPDPR